MLPTDDHSEDLRWRIPCRDSGGENRTVSVLVMGDRVAVVLPPGDTLIFDANEADDFAALLDKVSTFTEPSA
ncbi:hypothetical protein OOZ19_20200 [Saccharopolyspora sp. NFXS83]|uniref:hypothetical protein n=1 Tax=Saccharopolyspora sp. NFXS83 TaxID=2993560 RepID=UPI00224A6062|nr:hypothetical protein [Saccharopolyspora sp. NFXS83]MCX2732565.1 hypothetical protein [Saccharopolyspora sp. NFXS83]